jgi:hypothetical protein
MTEKGLEIDVSCELPQQVVFLGQALAPVATNLHNDMAQLPPSSDHEFNTLADLELHMGLIERALIRLLPLLEEMMKSVIKNEHATMLDAGRAAGRLEQVINEFVRGYQLALTSKPGEGSGEARELLLDVYRHHVSEIALWLDRLVSAIANPLNTLKAQNIQLSPEVVMPIHLNLTSPPQMGRLLELVLEHQRVFSSQEHFQQAPKVPGLLATIGAIAFGLGAVNSFGGKHHD